MLSQMYKLPRFSGCDYRRGMDWWMDLLATYTHDSELQAICSSRSCNSSARYVLAFHGDASSSVPDEFMWVSWLTKCQLSSRPPSATHHRPLRCAIPWSLSTLSHPRSLSRKPGEISRYSNWLRAGQSGAGAGFLRVLRFPLQIFIPPNSPSSHSFHQILHPHNHPGQVQ
jgi:hypothetical protein